MAKFEEEVNQPLERMDRYLKNIQKHTCVLSYTKKGVCTTKTKRWDVLRKVAKKIATEDEAAGKTVKEPQDLDPGVQLLPRQDIMVYGTIPTMEPRQLLKCKNCGKVFYPQDIRNHKNCSRRPHTLPNIVKKKLKTKPNGSSNGKKPSTNGDSPQSSSTNSNNPTPQSIVSSVVVSPVQGVKDFEFKRPYTPPPLKPAVHRPPGSPSPSMPQLKVSVTKIGSSKVTKPSPLILSAPSEATSTQKLDSKLPPSKVGSSSKVVTSSKTALPSKVSSSSVSSHHSSSSKSSSSSGVHSSSKSSSSGHISRSSSSSSSSSSYHGSKSSSSSSHHSPKSLSSSSSFSSNHHRSRSPSSSVHHSPKLPSSKSSSSSHHGSSHHSSSSSSSHHSSKSSSSSSKSSSSTSAISKSTPMDTLPPSSSLSSSSTSSHHHHSSNSSSSHSSSRHKKTSSSGSSKRSISSSSSGSSSSTSSTSSSNKNSPRNFSPDSHCGVIEGGRGPCMRSITCSNHRLHLRKQVPGRSKDIHQLIAERRAAKENEMKAIHLPSTQQPALVQPAPNGGSKNYVSNSATGCVRTVVPAASTLDIIKKENHFEPFFTEFVYPEGLENTADIMQKLVAAGMDLDLSEEKKFQATMHSVQGALNNMPIMVVPVRPLSGICEVIKFGKTVVSMESKKPTYPPAKKAAVMPITSNYTNSSHVRIYKSHPKPVRFANFGTRRLGGAVMCANPLLEDQKNDMLSKIDFALESNILKDSERKTSDLNGFVTHVDVGEETDSPTPAHPVENGRIPEPAPQPIPIRRIMSRHELIIRLIDRFGF